ncbi:hypothetical protein [Crateriforma conspicua]|uniref:Uncharacterized protein n=1 Tax=Crateriforma conspicua TaxID=2527996 RepID=A0A5C5Y693_9PLAN|nr:hypothetical protein [Crateriforma conspicua]TWT71206.1 hypothetical protein Pan14r_35160 [Crateriforma conspicua]
MIRCEQFQQRLDDQMDRRQPVHQDSQLIEHAKHCSTCAVNLSVARSIQQMEPATTANHPSAAPSSEHHNTRNHSTKPFSIAWASAACVAIGLMIYAWPDPASPSVQTAGRSETQANRYAKAILPKEPALVETSDPTSPIDRITNTDPGLPQSVLSDQWLAGSPTPSPSASAWQQWRPDMWVGQTMPVVRSVRSSVAPVGRSLLKAMALLTSDRAGETS